jgi:hypothetical protein
VYTRQGTLSGLEINQEAKRPIGRRGDGKKRESCQRFRAASSCRSLLAFGSWQRKAKYYSVKGRRNQIQSSADCRPPAAFISRNWPCLAVYIFVTSHVLADAANAPPVAGYRRRSIPLLCLCLSFLDRSDCAPPPPGPAFLAYPGCHRFHFDRDEPRRLAHTAPSTGLAPMTTPVMTSNIGRGLQARHLRRRRRRRQATETVAAAKC